WLRASDLAEKNRWHSLPGKRHPHWVWIRFRHAARIERAVVHLSHRREFPVVMLGEFSSDGGVNFSTLFTSTNNQMPESFAIEKSFNPVATDNFRIRILQSSDALDEAQLSEVEVFGKFVDEPKTIALSAI